MGAAFKGWRNGLDLAKPTLYQNWLTVEDITSLLNLADCEVIKQTQEILLPLATFHFSPTCPTDFWSNFGRSNTSP